jgi:ABC-2 type transport system permease protein
MIKFWLVAQREIRERVRSRSFILMALIGPVILLALLYALFSIAGSEKQTWNVLVMDKNEVFSNRIAPQEDPRFSFTFINDFAEYDDFAELELFSNYDMMVVINEKIVSNKWVIVGYRERPSEQIKRRLIHLVERRMEEIMVAEFTDLSVSRFREIKQPLNFSFKNVYDPKNEEDHKAAWVGYTFGVGIMLFVFLFGMTILRSVSREKTNRIVEVLLASVSPRQLLGGKVCGIGITALIQFVLWVALVAIGLYIFRQTFFPDLLNPEVLTEQFSAEAAQVLQDELAVTARIYNEFVDLVYRDIHYGNMLIFFTLFFIGAYLFYGAFFAMIGAAMGSESDGQQYIIPISLMLIISVFSGYYVIHYPQTGLSEFLGFLPFTAPVVMMIQLSNGFESGESWQLFLSLFILFVSSGFVFVAAGKIYKNGILQFGHRLRLSQLLNWLKKA